MSSHVTVGEYKGHPTITFHSPKSHDDVISFREQVVSFGASKANLILLAVAANGIAPVLELLLEVGKAYEPAERQAKANTPLTDAQRKKIEQTIAELTATPRAKTGSRKKSSKTSETPETPAQQEEEPAAA